MKKTSIIILLSFLLVSCQRSCNSFDRSFQTTDRNYRVSQYSGGKLIKTYEFRGIINNQEHSDGYYWYQHDTLIEVSGSVIVESWK